MYRSPVTTVFDQPHSFANGRYQVKEFLGEGGKKKVYLAHDTTLDREVVFALIKTEGLDQTSPSRITRDAQAMGRSGFHPHTAKIGDFGLAVSLDRSRPTTEGMMAGTPTLILRQSCFTGRDGENIWNPGELRVPVPADQRWCNPRHQATLH